LKDRAKEGADEAALAWGSLIACSWFHEIRVRVRVRCPVEVLNQPTFLLSGSF